MSPISNISNALSAYANVAGTGLADDAAVATPAGTGMVGGGDFASMVKDGLQTAVEAGKQSEAASKKAISGKADLRDVVAAVNNAEVTLQTVVAVRDKVIGAYNDILKMPI